MDTGEFLAIDHSFSEANQAYAKVTRKMGRVVNALVDHTVAIHRYYHKKTKCEWHNCNMTICRHTQFVLEFEGLEFE